MDRRTAVLALTSILLGSCLDREADFSPMTPPATKPVGRILVYEGLGLFSTDESEEDLQLALGQSRTDVEAILGASLGSSYGSETYRRGGVDYEIMYDNKQLTSQIRLYGNRFLVASNTQSGLVLGSYGSTRSTLEANYDRPATMEYEHWLWPENGIAWYPDIATGRVHGVAIRKPTLLSHLSTLRLVDNDQDGYPSSDSLFAIVSSTTGNRHIVAWIDYRPRSDTTDWIPLFGPETLLVGAAKSRWSSPLGGGCGAFHDLIGIRLRLADLSDTATPIQIRTLRDTIPIESYPKDGIKLVSCS